MLRRHFDTGSFTRGEQYHRQGRVSAPRSEAGQDGTVRVTAQVRGSLPSPYSQDIRLVLRNGAITSVGGDCDCPVGFNCKHVAAALLSWAGSRPATAPASALKGTGSLHSRPSAAVPAGGGRGARCRRRLSRNGPHPSGLCAAAG
ncbi:SWIM zinc finger family protein [Azospirillum oryzae]|uniref:SWIM zinc finger family protein n=1 Tax=Azospirillum oryzae TaxID=286727 RepID=UPI001FE5BF09|nr:SWIM zinc finger family protein [Azospirillum oryzae]